MAGLIIVTGGSRGIGAAICHRLAQDGHAIAVNYTSDSAAADKVVAVITAAGGRAGSFAADMGDPAQIERLFADAQSALGPLAGLVANAGIIGTKARMAEQTAPDMTRLFAVNVIGAMLCAGHAARILSTRSGGPGGAIVMLSSVAARTGGMPAMAPYAATKGAIEAFTKGFANEVALDGIRVNAIAPGLIATEMASPAMRESARGGIPIGRLGEASEIAEAAAWLISPASSYVTGSIMTVSGGR